MRRAAALVALVAVALPAAASARNDYRVVFPYRIGGFDIRGGTYRGAVHAFGQPSHMRSRSLAVCELQWDEQGLQLRFRTPSEHPCSRDGLRQSQYDSASILSRRWRVDRGVRVGDTWARLTQLYAAFRGTEPRSVDLSERVIPVPHTQYVKTVNLEAVIDHGRVLRIDLSPG